MTQTFWSRGEFANMVAVEAALASLPSYTQLGIASLMPNRDLEIADAETGMVLVNGQGLENHRKILETGATVTPGDPGHGRESQEVMGLDKDAARADPRAQRGVCLSQPGRCHRRRAGPVRAVFDAAEDAIEDVIKLVKLAGANASKYDRYVDHRSSTGIGLSRRATFPRPVLMGDQVLYRDRRFILGHGLKANRGRGASQPRGGPTGNGHP